MRLTITLCMLGLISLFRFSSPSDNLSPMSQKLMLADRQNAAIKSYYYYVLYYTHN